MSAPGLADTVKVVIDGLRGEMRENARLHLSLVAAEGDDDLDEARIRSLHRRAEEEIGEALAPFGYYQPTLRASLERQAADGTAWVATYDIEPGPALRITRLDVRVGGAGTDDPALVALVEGFPLAEGDVLDQRAYEETKGALQDYAARAGYFDAAFEVAEIRIDRHEYTSEIELVFDPGPRFRFGDVRFEQEFLDPLVVRGYLTFEPGEPFDLRELMKLQSALSASPYFSRVEVVPDRDTAEGDRVPIVVTLSPSARQKWTAGAGYGTDTGLRGRVGLELRRVNRQGHQSESALLGSQIEKSFVANYKIPGAYPRTAVLTFSLGFRALDTDASDSRTGLAGIGLDRLRGRWRESYSLTFQREDFEIGLDAGISDLLIPQASWSLTEADDRVFPSRARHFELLVRGAAEGALSNATFLQGRADAKQVRSLGPEVRILGRASVGWTETDDFRLLPPTVRFFAGGDRSVRGYGYQELGPPDEAGQVIGGEALVLGSIEVDWLFYERFGRWGLAAFYDLGNAGHDLGALVDDLRSGVGGGLRWLSPIGLVRADLAFAIDEPGTPLRFHLAIGPDL